MRRLRPRGASPRRALVLRRAKGRVTHRAPSLVASGVPWRRSKSMMFETSLGPVVGRVKKGAVARDLAKVHPLDCDVDFDRAVDGAAARWTGRRMVGRGTATGGVGRRPASPPWTSDAQSRGDAGDCPGGLVDALGLAMRRSATHSSSSAVSGPQLARMASSISNSVRIGRTYRCSRNARWYATSRRRRRALPAGRPRKHKNHPK